LILGTNDERNAIVKQFEVDSNVFASQLAFEGPNVSLREVIGRSQFQKLAVQEVLLSLRETDFVAADDLKAKLHNITSTVTDD
jgi:hypothetical protein